MPHLDVQRVTRKPAPLQSWQKPTREQQPLTLGPLGRDALRRKSQTCKLEEPWNLTAEDFAARFTCPRVAVLARKDFNLLRKVDPS